MLIEPVKKYPRKILIQASSPGKLSPHGISYPDIHQDGSTKMARILNFGSLNIDHVYQVPHFVRPGETLASRGYSSFVGGKGCNQSVALARAGAAVAHAGKVGHDGVWLKEFLAKTGVDASLTKISSAWTGHAIIQVSGNGENSIILHGGANHDISPEDAAAALEKFGEGDWLLLQNEISSIPEIMRLAHARGLKIALNPAPISEELRDYPLDLVSTFILNEIEGSELSGEKEEEKIIAKLAALYPKAAIVLTLGSRGVRYKDAKQEFCAASEKVKAIDTTAAGDTFIGYFLADIIAESPVETALKNACKAAAICVTRKGAALSIPERKELAEKLISR